MDANRTLVAGIVLVVLVAVVGVVALSGGFGGDPGGDAPDGDPGGATTTTTEGEGDPATLADLDGSDYPTGVDREGVTDGEALARAHNRSLDGRSYEMTFAVNRTIVQEDSSRTIPAVQTALVDGEGTVLVTYDRGGRSSFERTVWANRSVGYSRLDAGGGVRFGRANADRIARNTSGFRPLGGLLAAGNFTPVELAERDGTTAVVLRADEAGPNAPAQLGSVRSVSAFSGRAVVGTDGVIYELHVEVEFVDARGDDGRAVFDFSIEGLGSTAVDRPDWVSRAINETSPGIRPGPDPAVSPGRGRPAPA